MSVPEVSYVMPILLYFQGKILVGTKESEFIEINEKSGGTQAITCGHGEGELWGLSVHPSMPRFATASEDGTVRIWDCINKVWKQPTSY